MDDYISREEAKRFFNLNFGGVSHAIIASRLLDEIPAADVSPVRHGRWEKVAWWQHQNRYECNECSLCGCRVKPKFTYNYCPNCGARMDLEDIP